MASRWHSHGKARILITPRPHADGAVTRALRFTNHKITFESIPPGGGDFDLVIPASIEALLAANRDPVLCRRNPLPIPSEPVIHLCNDKAKLNQRLIETGFARHIPASATTGKFPYILKKSQDSCSANAFLVDDSEAEKKYRAEIESGDYLQQVWIEGNIEYAAHILFYDQAIQHIETTRYTFAGERPIHGKSELLNSVRCKSRFTELFTAILKGIEFQGLCCIDYRVHHGIPMIWEINPRIGFNASPYILPFIRAMDWKRSN